MTTTTGSLAPPTQTERRQVTYVLAYAERFGRLPRRTPEYDDNPPEDDA